MKHEKIRAKMDAIIKADERGRIMLDLDGRYGVTGIIPKRFLEILVDNEGNLL